MIEAGAARRHATALMHMFRNGSRGNGKRGPVARGRVRSSAEGVSLKDIGNGVSFVHVLPSQPVESFFVKAL
jgi:hypothetical protein